MSNKRKKLKKGQKRYILKLFLSIVAATLAVCVAAVGLFVYNYNTRVLNQESTVKPGTPGWDEEEELEADPFKKTIAVFGVDDDGYRPDAMFTLHFDSETNKAKVISIPRDTKVTWSEQQKLRLDYYGKSRVSVSKINEMTAYGGIENIRDFTVNEIENILGVPVDNYVIIDLDTFKDFIDAIGGVEMYVPQDMYYVDNAGGLYINLKEGYQTLDGDKAEQFVRFRRYTQGDVARIEAQQLFLEAVAHKITSPSIITKLPTLVNMFFDNVQTDITLWELPEYYTYLMNFDVSNLEFYTLPGEGRYENGVSYFFIDWNQMDEFLDEVLYDKSEEEELEGEVIIDKSVTIEVMNGSGLSGAAGRGKELVEANGYTVESVGNYFRSDLEETIIFAKDIEQARQFLEIYPDATIEQDPTITYDIQIVVGRNEG